MNRVAQPRPYRSGTVLLLDIRGNPKITLKDRHRTDVPFLEHLVQKHLVLDRVHNLITPVQQVTSVENPKQFTLGIQNRHGYHHHHTVASRLVCRGACRRCGEERKMGPLRQLGCLLLQTRARHDNGARDRLPLFKRACDNRDIQQFPVTALGPPSPIAHPPLRIHYTKHVHPAVAMNDLQKLVQLIPVLGHQRVCDPLVQTCALQESGHSVDVIAISGPGGVEIQTHARLHLFHPDTANVLHGEQ